MAADSSGPSLRNFTNNDINNKHIFWHKLSNTLVKHCPNYKYSSASVF